MDVRTGRGLVLAGAIAGGFTGCERSQGTAPPDRERRSGSRCSHTAFAPLYVAKEKGWLQEEFLRQGRS